MGPPFPVVSDETFLATVLTLVREEKAILVSSKGTIQSIVTAFDIMSRRGEIRFQGASSDLVIGIEILDDAPESVGVSLRELVGDLVCDDILEGALR